MPSGERDNRLLSIFGEQRDALLRFLQRRVGNASLAEDLTQETWLRAASGGSGVIENPRAYLFRIAANLALDHQRRAGHGVEVETPETVTRNVADRTPSPEAVALHRGELERLLSVLERLPARRREVFVLAKFDGLSYAEIARRLEISRNTVITHMVAALKQLEREMAAVPDAERKS